MEMGTRGRIISLWRGERGLATWYQERFETQLTRLEDECEDAVSVPRIPFKPKLEASVRYSYVWAGVRRCLPAGKSIADVLRNLANLTGSSQATQRHLI